MDVEVKTAVLKGAFCLAMGREKEEEGGYRGESWGSGREGRNAGSSLTQPTSACKPGRFAEGSEMLQVSLKSSPPSHNVATQDVETLFHRE